MTSHKHNFQQVASDKRWMQLTGAMNDVRKDMNKLAPNPHGAERGESRVAAGNSRDSMMASLLIDCFFGAGINAAIGDMLNLPDGMAGFDYSTAIDLYDEYWTDRQNSENGQKDRANGGYELGETGAISGGFNRTARTARAKPTEWDVYMRDLPARRTLEQDLAGMDYKIQQIQGEYRARPKTMALAM